jgi:hypothetical protein
MNIPSAETSAWNIAEGKNEGKPSLIRFRPDLESYIGSPSYPQRLVMEYKRHPTFKNGDKVTRLS